MHGFNKADGGSSKRHECSVDATTTSGLNHDLDLFTDDCTDLELTCPKPLKILCFQWAYMRGVHLSFLMKIVMLASTVLESLSAVYCFPISYS